MSYHPAPRSSPGWPPRAAGPARRPPFPHSRPAPQTPTPGSGSQRAAPAAQSGRAQTRGAETPTAPPRRRPRAAARRPPPRPARCRVQCGCCDAVAGCSRPAAPLRPPRQSPPPSVPPSSPGGSPAPPASPSRCPSRAPAAPPSPRRPPSSCAQSCAGRHWQSGQRPRSPPAWRAARARSVRAPATPLPSAHTLPRGAPRA
mmetsp:Transcript_46069/g.116566  ORF Transcript_46069/g.116566 Transcript_46069/m.116566 type:complete len:201 (-) Transcript_46069:378-980(-)